MFIKQESKIQGLQCTYRLCQEGLNYLFPYITKRIINIKENDFYILLKNRDPHFKLFDIKTYEQLSLIGIFSKKKLLI